MNPVKNQSPATQEALILDLDRDVLGGDLKAERFWGAVGQDWRNLWSRPEGAVTDGALIPIPEDVLETCATARAAGREVVLHDAGDPTLASVIAGRIGSIDRVVPGSAPPAPRPVARRGTRATTVLKQMRLHQWVKNVLIFLPLMAAHAFDGITLFAAARAFLAFGLVASGVYVLNDLADLGADRKHRTKCHRPFASGRLPVRYGFPMLVTLLVAGFAIAASVTGALIVVLAGYFVLTTAYSMNLKGRLAVDIVVLALLYTVRIVAGAAATGITPSVWLLSFSTFLFLALASVKRLAELVELESHRGAKAAAGRAYTTEDRPIIAMIATSAGFIAVLVFALYLDSPEVRALYDAPMVLWGICVLLLFWVSRVVLLAHRGLVHEDPVVFALNDTVSRWVGVAAVILFAIAMLA